MTKTPSADDLHSAAQWLDVYEGAEAAAIVDVECSLVTETKE